MLYEVASSDVVTQEHWFPHVLTGGSSKKSDRGRVECMSSLAALVHDLAGFRSVFPMFEIDLSSVNPCFAPTNRPSSIEEFYGEIALEEGIEHGLAIRMPPRDRRAIKLEVKNVKKGNPVIIELDWM